MSEDKSKGTHVFESVSLEDIVVDLGGDPDYIDAFKERLMHGDKVAGLIAFVLCHNDKRPPPDWLCDWLADAFEAWIGAKVPTLDKALGITPSDSPEHSRQKKKRRTRRDAWDIYLLNTVFGFSVESAAEMVQLRNEQNGEESPGADWLAEDYRKRNRQKISDETAEILHSRAEFESWRADYLAKFPKPSRGVAPD